MKHFGEHLTIDGYKGDREKLLDKDNILQFLSKVPDKLGMSPLSEIVIEWCEPNHIRDPGGWSGFLMVKESHFSVHTFPNKNFVSADVYTCKNDLDENYVKQYLIDLYELKEVESNFIKRGLKYADQ